MKTTKTILAIAIIMALLLVTLCGCGETRNDEIIAEQSNEVEIDVVEPIEVKEDEGEDFITTIPLIIEINNGLNFKDEIIKHIESSRAISREHQDYRLYSDEKISDINEFYSLDNLTIDGYVPYNVCISEGAFNYSFVPIEEANNEYVIALDIGVIWITIWRNDDESDPLKDIVEDADIQGQEYLYDGDTFYYLSNRVIFSRIGDTLININVPQELNSYEYLCDLAFKVIETAELVVVGE